MSIFHYISVGVPLALWLLMPWLLARMGAVQEKERRSRWMLALACLLFFVSWYLPSPLIDGRDTSFTTHLVGGGIFTGLLWWYGLRSLQRRLSWVVAAASLFALVSALGCVNELAELFMVKFGIARITLEDTSWDIFANSLGAGLVFVVWSIQTSLTRASEGWRSKTDASE